MITIDLSGKTAIVTGAGNGIGRAIALKLGAAGANIAAVDLFEDAAKKTADEINEAGGIAIAIKTDVSRADEVEAMVNNAVSTWQNGVDIMVNNAGISIIEPFLETSEETFAKQVDINLRGCYYGCKATLPHMIKKGGGHIVNLASLATKVPSNLHAIYAATKCGIIGMTNSIAAEFGAYNIKANTICPGVVRTEMWEKSLNNMERIFDGKRQREDIWNGLYETLPLKRPQTPEDMANAVLFLSSYLSENITAQSLNINGGRTTL